MSFVAFAALAVAVLVAAPLVAHLLRRGQTQEQEFPPAALVPVSPTASRKRSRLEDRALFAVRGSMILALAMLGAVPLARCERLSLARNSGASVAFALVIDDSLSMRSRLEDESSRFDRALDGAEDLLRSAREGDAVAIVLAGEPARLALAATTDLSAAREALGELTPSDRETDLPGAVQLARAALNALSHVDKRVVLLSDLAGDPIPSGEPAVWAPLEALTHPAPNCAILRADREDDRVHAAVACNAALGERELQITIASPTSTAGPLLGPPDEEPKGKSGDVVGTASLSTRPGEQIVVVAAKAAAGVELDAHLVGEDAISHDDIAPVADRSSALIVGVVADPSVASVQTGGPTVVEQALLALPTPLTVRPIPLLPEDDKEYRDLSAILVDDPPGLSPEARAALVRYVEQGGLALSLLGPRAATPQLSATLEPFAYGAVRWEEVAGLGIEPRSLSFMGPEAQTLSDLSRRGRARLDGASMKAAKVVGTWQDGAPWLLERHLGRGLVFTVGLPASVEESDFALRPAFLALLDHVVRQADERRGPGQTLAGGTWVFRGADRVSIRGPEGALAVTRKAESGALTATPSVRGRYRVVRDTEERGQVVTLGAREILREPQNFEGTQALASVEGEKSHVDISREVALAVLALFALELSLRASRRRGKGRGGHASSAPDPT